MEINLYTDGSFDKEKNLGSWAFGTQDKIIDCGIITQPDGTWQIQSEVTACINAIKYAENQKYDKVIIYHDLQGLSKWYFGLWKAKKDATKMLRNLSKETKIEVEFVWVKGHKGIQGNELVDSKCRDLLKENHSFLTFFS